VGYDLNDQFSIDAVAAGAYQHQTGDDVVDNGRGALPFQVALSFRATAADEFYTKFGFAAGNGLNEYFAATADCQYMAETYDTDEDEIHGLILGLRATAAF
jgi:hypothetical protein